MQDMQHFKADCTFKRMLEVQKKKKEFLLKIKEFLSDSSYGVNIKLKKPGRGCAEEEEVVEGGGSAYLVDHRNRMELQYWHCTFVELMKLLLVRFSFFYLRNDHGSQHFFSWHF